MAEHNDLQVPPRGTGRHRAPSRLSEALLYRRAVCRSLAKHAAHKAWSHVDYLAKLLEGEADVRRDRATQSRIRLARFPVMKTLEQFRWDWPTRINRLQVQNHFRLGVYQGQSQPNLSGRCRPGENASGDGVGLYRLPPGLRGALCQCH